MGEIGPDGLDGGTMTAILFPAVGAFAVRTFTLSVLALIASLPVLPNEGFGLGLGLLIGGVVDGTLAVLSSALLAFFALFA